MRDSLKHINPKIYEAKKAAALPYWRIADELGISEITLLRKLRHQLQPDQEAEVLEAIRRAEIKVKLTEAERKGWEIREVSDEIQHN